MIGTIIITAALVGSTGYALLKRSNHQSLKPNEKGCIETFGQITATRGPGKVILLPWEKIYIRPTSQIKGQFATRLTTGGQDADEFTLRIMFIYHIVDVAKSVFAYRGDLNQGVEEFVQSSFQEALLNVGGHAILDGSLPSIVEKALVSIKQIATSWGLEVDCLKIYDIDLSDPLKAKIAQIREAEGKAEAIKITSQAEVDAYKREKEVQGDDYRFHQILDNRVEMAKAGALKVVGAGYESIAGLMAIEKGVIK